MRDTTRLLTLMLGGAVCGKTLQTFEHYRGNYQLAQPVSAPLPPRVQQEADHAMGTLKGVPRLR